MSAADDTNFTTLLNLYSIYYPQLSIDSALIQNPPTSGGADQLNYAASFIVDLAKAPMSSLDLASFYDARSYFQNTYPSRFLSTSKNKNLDKKSSRLFDLLDRFERASINNPRINPTLPVAAANAAPTAGQVGYNNTGISPTNYTTFSLRTNVVNGPQPNPFPNTWPMKIKGGTAYNDPTFQALYPMAFYDLAGTLIQTHTKCVFEVTDTKPVLSLIGYGHTHYFNINGQRLSNGLVGNAGGGMQDLQLDLTQIPPGPGGRYRIELLSYNDSRVQSIKVLNSSSIFTVADDPQFLLFQDSLANTSPNAGMYDCFGAVFSDHFGTTPYVFSEGQTGYNSAPTNKRTFSQRMDVAYAMGFDPVTNFYIGGINDADDQPFIDAFKSSVIKAVTFWPDTFHVFGGSFAQNTLSNQTAKIAQEKKMAQIVYNLGFSNVAFMPIMTEKQAYIYGQGDTTTPGTGANAGNVNRLFNNTDVTHWNAAGHAEIGMRAAKAVGELIRKYVYN